MIEAVTGDRIGADINPNAINALISIRDCLHELPKNNQEFTKEDYENLRNGWDYKHKSYAGFAFAFGSRWLEAWSKGKSKDYVNEAYNSARQQSPLLQGVTLVHCAYWDLEIPANSLIYCDPPYNGTTSYSRSNGLRANISHTHFWRWCRKKTTEGHTVFISEYNAPRNGFKCVYQKEQTVTVNLKQYRRNTERLFKCCL